MNTYIGRIKIGIDEAAVGSTLYGICVTAENSATKVITLNDFDNVLHGVTIYVRFDNGNTVSSNVLLQIGNNIYPVVGNCLCNRAEVLSFTFDETENNILTTDTTKWHWRVTGRITEPATSSPQPIGSAAIGTSLKYAKEDHVHNIEVTTGTNSGEIVIAGQTVKPKDLGTAAYTEASAYATTAQGLLADNAMPRSGGQFTGNVTFANNTTLTINTPTENGHAATKEYVDNAVGDILDSTDAMVFKGTIGSNNATVANLPISDYSAGWTYKVITAGNYGDTNTSLNCEVGDLIIATNDAVTNQNALNPNHWIIIPGNSRNTVLGPVGATDGHVVLFNGSTGQLIKDSGFTIGTSVPSNAVFTDTWNALTDTQPGYVATAPADITKFLRGDASWATLPAASSSVAGITKVGAADGAAAYEHGVHVTTATVKEALEVNATHENKFLRKDGIWYAIPGGVSSVATLTGEITAVDLVEQLGLSKALRFRGITTSDMSKNFTDIPAGITGYAAPEIGDVVIDSNTDYEYVCIEINNVNNNNTYTWEKLGGDSSWASSTHTHGEITNDGKIGSVADLAIYTDTGGVLTAGSLAYTSPSADGTASSFIATVAQDSKGQIIATKANLPIASTTTAGIIQIGNDSTEAMPGNTIVNKVKTTAVSNNAEYEILGSSGGALLTSDEDYDVVYNSNITFNPFTGKITANGFIGSVTGNADTATAANINTYQNGVAYYSNTSGTFASTTAGNDGYIFIGSGANNAPTWQEILPIAHGGTGVNSFSRNQVILSDNINGITNLVSRAYADSITAGIIGTSDNFVTERDIYYGLPLINNLHDYDALSTYFSPVTAGSQYSLLVSGVRADGNTTLYDPQWTPAATLNSEVSTNTNLAQTILTLGNNITSTVIGNSEGKIILYSADTASHTIKGASTTINYIHTLANINGYIVQAPSASMVGNSTQPVYIDADGMATALTYTANRLYYSASTTSFTATNHYANTTQIFINKTLGENETINDTLYVNGSTAINGSTVVTGAATINGATTINNNTIITGVAQITNTTDITISGNTVTGGALDISGSVIIDKKLYIKEDLWTCGNFTLSGALGIGADPDNSHILHIHGQTLISANGSNNTSVDVAHLDIYTAETQEALPELQFWPEESNSGSIGLNLKRWESLYIHRLVSNNSYPLYVDGDSTFNGDLIPDITDTYNLGLENVSNASKRYWKSLYLSNLIQLQSQQSQITIETNDVTNQTTNTTALNASIVIQTLIPTINLETLASGNQLNWIINNNQGNFSITASNSLTYILGDKNGNGFKITPRLYINEDVPASNLYNLYINGTTKHTGNIDYTVISSNSEADTMHINVQGASFYPEDTNNGSLGLGSGGLVESNETLVSGPHRWSNVYIGTADTYADPYKPIYWLDGVPTKLTGTIQQAAFTISSGSHNTTLLSEAYDSNTRVIQIIIDNGAQYIQNKIKWTSNDPANNTNYGSIVLEASINVSDDVSGYILTAYGCLAPQQQSQNGSSNGGSSSNQPSGDNQSGNESSGETPLSGDDPSNNEDPSGDDPSSDEPDPPTPPSNGDIGDYEEPL